MAIDIIEGNENRFECLGSKRANILNPSDIKIVIK